MANPSKNKGDRAERDAVAYLLETCGDLCLPKSMRMLGAGRAEDVGDLHVFADTAIQVRAYAMTSIGTAVRSSAADAVVQARNGGVDFALGMVPYPRARAGTVKWLACIEPAAWPGGAEALPIEPIEFGLLSKALAWVRDDDGPHGYMAYPRHERIARLVTGTAAPVLVAPFEAWLAAYRLAKGSPLTAVRDPAGPVGSVVEEQHEQHVDTDQQPHASHDRFDDRVHLDVETDQPQGTFDEPADDVERTSEDLPRALTGAL